MTLLEVSGVSVTFDGFRAINNLSLQIGEPELRAVIGPNGAGKTTCFNLLTKFLQPTRGTITYDGRDITRMAPADIARLGMVRSFQISAVFPDLSVLQNVRVALQQTLGTAFSFWKSERTLNQLAEDLQDRIEGLGGVLEVDVAGHAGVGQRRAPVRAEHRLSRGRASGDHGRSQMARRQLLCG